MRRQVKILNPLRIMVLTLIIMLSGVVQASPLRDEALKNIAKQYDVVFFYRGYCPHCHNMAPGLQAMAETYGFNVIANKLDGPTINGFQNQITDMKLFDEFRIYALPTTVLIDKTNNKGVVLANHALFGEQLEIAVLKGAASIGEYLA